MATMGERLQHMRKQKRMTQQELSRAAGVRRATISALESGKTQGLTVASARGLARALGVSLDWLVGTWDEDEAAPVSKRQRGRRPSRVG